MKAAAWETWKYITIQLSQLDGCEFPYNESEEKLNFEIWWNEKID